jgi:hypothetical protein
MGLYTRFRALWADGEAGGTPITAAALNYIEDGIVAASDHGQLAGLADDDHPQYLLRTDATTAYLAKADYDEIDITAAALGPTRGAPSLAAAATFWPVWLLDAATTEAVSGVIRTPGDWTTVNIVLWWINAGTGAGDVRLRAVTRNEGNGGVLGADANAYVTVAAQLQNKLVATTLATGIAVDDLKVFLASIERPGADALDTLANDIGVVSILISKAS